MAERVQEQARRLARQLEQSPGPPAADTAQMAAVRDQAAALRASLAGLPDEVAAGLLSAELGFMPGPAASAALASHGRDWQDRLGRLTQGAAAVSSWLGPDGQAAYRAFLIRGYIRGFAHLWREATGAEASPEPASEFFVFAADCLARAGVADEPAPLLQAALAADWRTAGG